MAGNPPFEKVLDVFNWFPKVLPQPAGTGHSLFSHRDVGKGCEVIVTVIVNLWNWLALEYIPTKFADLQPQWACQSLTHSHPLFPHVYFEYEVFCIIDPLFFPFLLSEVFKLESWMKDWFKCQCSSMKSINQNCTYPSQSDTLMNNQSLSNTNWSCCAWVSLQPGLLGDMATVWKNWGEYWACP